MLRRLFAASSRRMSSALDRTGGKTLAESDPEVANIIELEKVRQFKGLELIPSENYASRATLTALGSVFVNKYAEGYAGARYYGGNEVVDMSERLCIKRALAAFNLSPDEWGCNVQSLSGSPANFAVYTGLLKPHDRIMGLDLPHGGHLSHGFSTPKRKVSAVSIFWEQMPYQLNESTGLIDYEALEKSARLFRPKLLIAGASAYSRHIDYKRMRAIADEHDAYLLSDMAHISGLVASGLVPSPFLYSDVVTTTTHKTLRGPRGALIFFRKGVKGKDSKGNETHYNLEEGINSAVFPGLQGGPHQHTIAAISVALAEAASPAFKVYSKQILSNCQAFAHELMQRGFELVSGGSDNHLVLLNLTNKGIDGQRVEKVLELCNMHANKNTVPGDKSAMSPHGLRMGTPALTSRGLKEDDMRKVAGFVARGIEIALNIHRGVAAGAPLKEFKRIVEQPGVKEIESLREDVENFAVQFPIPGVDVTKLV